MTTRASATNTEVAERLCISGSMVSRIRSGERTPGMELMRTIALAYDFTIQDQFDAGLFGSYASAFERALVEHYG